MSKPTKFEDLDAAELYRSALEDFALPVEESEKGKKKVLVAAFVEGGVNWEDYVAQHPEVKPDEPVNVITASPAVTPPVVEKTEFVETSAPRVAEPLVADPDATYLIKMERDNALFWTRGHKFTADHPYAIVNADDADYILTKEDGFRQATPKELREFYG